MNNKYIDFVLVKKGVKTDLWAVESKRSGQCLCIIKWYAPWRQYCFFPHEDTVWNKDCLEDIKEFINHLMLARKIHKKGN